ncbi:nucleoside monophosphate kinase [Mycoplasmopsis ciconiae]|uniref:Adenylate kinase n=1 Tax=Mycoplasmopsis ciconiae TaxID=561067 RepID=A0ABU7MLJ8_9BACT|nr:nucleoside monophosphate kinase [Mycoplasmopsis ciconiae]
MIKIKTNIIFMGAPGVGKGTIAALVAQEQNLVHVSTGNIFREEIAKKTPLGLEVQNIVTSGGYVPDSITNKIVENKINQLKQQNVNFILDGYPRTIEQAKFLDTLKDLEFKVIELDAPQEVILERLSGRRTCSVCKSGYHTKFQPPKTNDICDKCQGQLIQREDDKPEAVIKRLEIYKEKTQPLLDYYNSQQRLVVVDATEAPDKVTKKVLNVFEK